MLRTMTKRPTLETPHGRYSKPLIPKRERPDGRYATVYAAPSIDDDDEWKEITAVEAPSAIASEPPATRKRSGDWVVADLREAHRLAASEE